MAIGYLEVKTIGRASGRSSVAAAAYRACECLADARTGLIHDFTRRDQDYILHREIVGWHGSRSELWNAVESAERRKDARTAREVVLALPYEVPRTEQLRLASGFAHYLHNRYGVAVDVAIHKAREGSNNIHAHLLFTTRAVEHGTQLAAKTRELDDKKTGPEHIEAWRSEWGERIGVDMRSYRRQGLDVEPQPKLGAAAALERRGIATGAGDALRDVQSRNAERASLAALLAETNNQIRIQQKAKEPSRDEMILALRAKHAELQKELAAPAPEMFPIEVYELAVLRQQFGDKGIAIHPSQRAAQQQQLRQLELNVAHEQRQKAQLDQRRKHGQEDEAQGLYETHKRFIAHCEATWQRVKEAIQRIASALREKALQQFSDDQVRRKQLTTQIEQLRPVLREPTREEARQRTSQISAEHALSSHPPPAEREVVVATPVQTKNLDIDIDR